METQWIHGVQPTGTISHETGVYGTLDCGHHTIVAECGGHSCNSETMRENQEANARLVASSPNLLAVAKLAQSLLSEEYGDSYEVLKQLDAAIAKVEGSGTQLPEGKV